MIFIFIKCCWNSRVESREILTKIAQAKKVHSTS